MWKYVNPGYGELLDEKLGTIKNKAYNPTNGMCLANGSSRGGINLPNLKEVYVKFDVYFYSGDRSYGQFYIGDGTNWTGLYKTNYSSYSLKIDGNKMSEFDFILSSDKLHKIVYHVKPGQKGELEVFIDNQFVKSYSGKISTSVFRKCEVGFDNNFISNIIIADYDIRDESVLVVPLGEPTGTWSGISDGEAKATEADQVLTQSLKIDDIKNVVGTDTVTSVSVAAYDIRYDSEKVNSMEASITKDGSNLTSATKSITNNAITPITFMKNMTIDNLANTSVSFKAKKV